MFRLVKGVSTISSTPLSRSVYIPTGLTLQQYGRLLEKVIIRSITGSVDVSYDGNIAVVTLNNTKRRNAMTEKMMVELANAVDDLQFKKEISGLVICGKGGTFCSGFDLKEAKKYVNDKKAKLDLNLLMQTTLTRIRQMGIVSVCAIDGYAIGGGAELTTCTDFRVMKRDEGSYIQFAHNKLALCPGWGGAHRLTQIIGRKRALEVMLAAERMNCERAKEIGLVDAIVEGNVVKGAKEFLSKYLQYNPESTKAIKTMIGNYETAVISSELLKQERDIFESIFDSPENRAAIKNSPVYKKE